MLRKRLPKKGREEGQKGRQESYAEEVREEKGREKDYEEKEEVETLNRLSSPFPLRSIETTTKSENYPCGRSAKSQAVAHSRVVACEKAAAL